MNYVGVVNIIMLLHRQVFRSDSPIYHCQKFVQHAFTNILPLQYFAMYGTLL